MRHLSRLSFVFGAVAALGLLAVLAFAWQSGHDTAKAIGVIDQISIDMDPGEPGPAIPGFGLYPGR
jgi:hypothetical protein